MASSSTKPTSTTAANGAGDDVNQQPPCLGTTTVTITVRGASGGKKRKEGLLTVFHIQGGDKKEEEGLRLSITDGKTVYHGKIDMSHVNMPEHYLNSLEKRSEALAEFLLRGHAKVPIDYTLQHDEDSGGDLITVKVKYYQEENNTTNNNKTKESDKVSTDKVKLAVGCKLERNNSSSNNNNNNSNKDDLFRFFKTLGESINQGKRKEIETKNQMKILQDQRDCWKNTANKLEGSWQREKDTIFHNFVKLYNATQEELQKTRSELDNTKAQLLAISSLDVEEQTTTNNNKKKKTTTTTATKKIKKEASAAAAAATTTTTKLDRKKRTQQQQQQQQQQQEEDDDVILDHPDDLDLERNAFDADMVDQLASGRKVNLSATVDDNDEDEDDDGVTNGSSLQKKKAKSVRTSKKKVKGGGGGDDDDDKSDDDSSNSPPPKKKKKKTRVAMKRELNYDSDSSGEKLMAKLFKNHFGDSD